MRQAEEVGTSWRSVYIYQSFHTSSCTSTTGWQLFLDLITDFENIWRQSTVLWLQFSWAFPIVGRNCLAKSSTNISVLLSVYQKAQGDTVSALGWISMSYHFADRAQWWTCSVWAILVAADSRMSICVLLLSGTERVMSCCGRARAENSGLCMWRQICALRNSCAEARHAWCSFMSGNLMMTD